MSSLQEEYITADACGVSISLYPPYNLEIRTERNVAAHLHKLYELHILLDGEAKITTPQKNYRLRKGEVALIPPRVYHSIKNISSQFQLISLGFQLYPSHEPPKPEQAQFQNILESTERAYPLLLGKQPELIQIIQQFQNYDKSQLGASALLHSQLIQFLVYLFRGLPLERDTSSTSFSKMSQTTKYIETERCRRIEAYISEHYTDADMSKLAGQLSITENHLRRILRSYYGESFTQLVNNHRVNVSKYYLQNTNKTISEISEMVGFQTFQNFSVWFRRCTSQSPSEYRAEHK